MLVSIVNSQRSVPVDEPSIAALARCTLRHLRIRRPGTIAIAFIGAQRMRTLNKRFLRHDRVTDVLSFRYDGAPARRGGDAAMRRRGQVAGEILIAPAMARSYARQHGVPYEQELSRYVVHGLLHWLGREDRTKSQQRDMRVMEDQLLARCGVQLRAQGSGLRAMAPSPQPPAPSRV